MTKIIHSEIDPDTGITRTWYTWDIHVTWTAPDWGEYSSGRVSYKEDGAQDWIYAGMGGNEVTIPDIDTSGDYIIAVGTRDVNGNCETEDDSSQITITLS